MMNLPISPTTAVTNNAKKPALALTSFRHDFEHAYTIEKMFEDLVITMNAYIAKGNPDFKTVTVFNSMIRNLKGMTDASKEEVTALLQNFSNQFPLFNIVEGIQTEIKRLLGIETSTTSTWVDHFPISAGTAEEDQYWLTRNFKRVLAGFLSDKQLSDYSFKTLETKIEEVVNKEGEAYKLSLSNSEVLKEFKAFIDANEMKLFINGYVSGNRPVLKAANIITQADTHTSFESFISKGDNKKRIMTEALREMKKQLETLMNANLKEINSEDFERIVQQLKNMNHDSNSGLPSSILEKPFPGLKTKLKEWTDLGKNFSLTLESVGVPTFDYSNQQEQRTFHLNVKTTSTGDDSGSKITLHVDAPIITINRHEFPIEMIIPKIKTFFHNHPGALHKLQTDSFLSTHSMEDLLKIDEFKDLKGIIDGYTGLTYAITSSQKDKKHISFAISVTDPNLAPSTGDDIVDEAIKKMHYTRTVITKDYEIKKAVDIVADKIQSTISRLNIPQPYILKEWFETISVVNNEKIINQDVIIKLFKSRMNSGGDKFEDVLKTFNDDGFTVKWFIKIPLNDDKHARISFVVTKLTTTSETKESMKVEILDKTPIKNIFERMKNAKIIKQILEPNKVIAWEKLLRVFEKSQEMIDYIKKYGLTMTFVPLSHNTNGEWHSNVTIKDRDNLTQTEDIKFSLRNLTPEEISKKKDELEKLKENIDEIITKANLLQPARDKLLTLSSTEKASAEAKLVSQINEIGALKIIQIYVNSLKTKIAKELVTVIDDKLKSKFGKEPIPDNVKNLKNALLGYVNNDVTKKHLLDDEKVKDIIDKLNMFIPALDLAIATAKDPGSPEKLLEIMKKMSLGMKIALASVGSMMGVGGLLGVSNAAKIATTNKKANLASNGKIKIKTPKKMMFLSLFASTIAIVSSVGILVFLFVVKGGF